MRRGTRAAGRRRFPAGFRLLLLLLALFPALAWAVGLPSERARWTATRVDELSIVSDASDRDTRDVASALLRLRDALAATTHLNVRAPLPTTVFLFRDADEFARFRDAAMGRKAYGTGGVFFTDDNGNFVLLPVTRGETNNVIYHEMTHYFVRNSVRGLPAWLDEGIAEFFSGFDVRGDAVRIGMPHEEHLIELRNEGLMPLAQLFAIDRKSNDYVNDTRRRGVFYAESWALVHYLMIGNPERRQQLPAFLAALDDHKPTEQAFQSAFHATYDDMERELRKYIHQFTMAAMRYTFADLKAKAAPDPAPIPRDEVLVDFAMMLAHTERAALPDAQAFAAEAMRINPANADAIALAATVNEKLGNFEEMTALFNRAIKLDPKDAMPYLAYADAIVARMRRAFQAGGRPAAGDVEAARALFSKAAQLAPGDPRAWRGIGVTYVMSDGDPAPGIAPLLHSFQLAAPDEADAYNLMLLYVRTRNADAAQKVFETIIKPSGNDAVIAAAQTALAELKAAH